MADMIPEMGYDRTIVVFSPEGRLYQVEYAREAIKRGSTAVGVRAKDGVVLGAVKPVSVLSVSDSYEKIYQIDDHVGMAASGMLSDARVLANQARMRCQVNRITYEEPMGIGMIARFLADRIHLSTLYAGMRPYGVGLLFGGVDESGPQLMETDPSGTVIEWKAHVIGKGAPVVEKLLKQKYDDSMKLDQAVRLAVETLQKSEKEAAALGFEVGVVQDRRFRYLSPQELKKYM